MENLDEALFDLAYQEGKSTIECLYDVYKKGKEDSIKEVSDLISGGFYNDTMKIMNLKQWINDQNSIRLQMCKTCTNCNYCDNDEHEREECLRCDGYMYKKKG